MSVAISYADEVNMVYIYKGELERDYFHVNIFINNYIGVSMRIMGYGFTAAIQIRKPGKTIRFKE